MQETHKFSAFNFVKDKYFSLVRIEKNTDKINFLVYCIK